MDKPDDQALRPYQGRNFTYDGAPAPDGAHIDFKLVGPWDAPSLAAVLPPAD